MAKKPGPRKKKAARKQPKKGGIFRQNLSRSPAHPDQARASKRGGAKATQQSTSSSGFPIVGIGASAGGLTAYTTLLKALPANTGMAHEELTQLTDDLSNLFVGVNIPIVFLGADLRIRLFTPVAGEILHLIPAELERRVTDIAPRSNPSIGAN